MTEWIEINVPYSKIPLSEEAEVPAAPNLDSEERERFGKSWQECFDQCTNLRNTIWLEVHDEALEAVETESDWNPLEEEDPEKTEAEEARLEVEVDRRFAIAAPEEAKHWKIIRQINAWRKVYPALLAWQEACQEARKQDRSKTFEGMGLAEPGVQIELEDGRRFLIGHINQLRGVCDDCTGFDSTDLVKRYRVILTAEELE